ncbi:hypothetical protein MKX01_001566 [Papaver californicum]|nr:hypothetical protein MKX01_001566 [Papaver californicum]
MTTFLRSASYNAKKDYQSECPWWEGPSLFEVLDALEIPQKDLNELGTNVLGKIESGSIREEDTLLIVPNQAQVKVLEVYCDEQRVKRAGPGENVRVKLLGVEEADILAGFVLASVENPITAVTEFSAQLQILELSDKAVLHAHSAVGVDCEIVELVHQIDPKTRQPIREKIPFVKNGAVVVCRIQVSNLMCIEKFSYFPQLGCFTLRTEGKTIAFGKVISI